MKNISKLLLMVLLPLVPMSMLTAQTDLTTNSFRIGTTDRIVGGSCAIKNFIVYNIGTGFEFTCNSSNVWVKTILVAPKSFNDFMFNGSPTQQCKVGDVGYQKDATPGKNLWLCTNTNSWNAVSPINTTSVPLPPSSGTFCLQAVDSALSWASCAAGTTGSVTYSTWTSLSTTTWDALSTTTWNALQ